MTKPSVQDRQHKGRMYQITEPLRLRSPEGREQVGVLRGLRPSGTRVGTISMCCTLLVAILYPWVVRSRWTIRLWIENMVPYDPSQRQIFISSIYLLVDYRFCPWIDRLAQENRRSITTAIYYLYYPPCCWYRVLSSIKSLLLLIALCSTKLRHHYLISRSSELFTPQSRLVYIINICWDAGFPIIKSLSSTSF